MTTLKRSLFFTLLICEVGLFLHIVMHSQTAMYMCSQCFFAVHVSDVEMQTHYDDFFEEVFVELEAKVGFLNV